MTADSYSPTKEQIKDTKMVKNEPNNVVLEVEERHFLFKCVQGSHFDKATHCMAELIGTAALMFLVCMSCVEGLGVENPHLQSALGCGLGVLVVVATFGGISHCHVNPAVTLAASIMGLISIPVALIYVICQVAGAMLGMALLRSLTPVASYFVGNTTVGMCMTLPNERITPLQGFGVELVITTLLVWMVCAIWDPRNQKWQDSTSIKFGFTIVVMAIAAGPYTGASMNPARSLAPAIFAGDLTSQWIYWVGPFLGALIGAFCYKYIFHREAPNCCCRISILKTELAELTKITCERLDISDKRF